jgi:hypothetical protein
MIRRWVRIVGTVFLLMGLFSAGIHGTALGTTVLTVEATPNCAGELASYRFRGQIAPEDQIAGVDAIRIEFKWDTTITAALNPPAGSVIINGEVAPSARWTIYPAPVDNNGATTSVALTVQLPRAGMLTTSVDILLTESAGIINPALERPCYSAFVWLLKRGVEVGYFASNQYTIARSRIQNVRLSCTPPIIGQKAVYEVSFVTGATGKLEPGIDYFRVVFEGQVSLPSTGAADCILINGVSCKGMVFRDSTSSHAMLLYSPVSIVPSQLVTITFCEDYGLVNPTREGPVSCTVSSSIETASVTSNAVAIGGLYVRDAKLALSDASAGARSAATISFATSALGRLAAGYHIMLDLPAGFASGSLAPAGTVMLNGLPTPYDVVGTLITIDAPAPVAAGGSVSLTLPLEAGLRNPLQQGPVSIAIRTTSDTAIAVATTLIEPPTVRAASAIFSTVAIGAQPSLRVSFVTSPAGALAAGTDTISLSFAPTFAVSPDIRPDSIAVNGMVVAQYAVQGQELQMVLPMGIAADSPVTITVAGQAALVNPRSPGSASLQIATSRDLTAVAVGPFGFREALPVACTLSPSVPNGQNGWYVGSPPTIMLDPGAGRSVWFRFDAQPFALYGGIAVTAPEGAHTLSFYGVDADGVTWEPVQREIRVDTVKPSMTLDAAGDVLGVSDGFVELSGHVSEPVQVLQFNSVPANVLSDLSFTLRLPAAQQSGMLGGYARDLAGNVTTSIAALRIDKTAPRVTMLSPTTQEVTVSSETLQVRCTIDELGEVSIGGNPAVFDGSAWTADVMLREGANAIVVEARDTVGNRSQVTLSVTYSRTTDIVLTVGKTTAAVGDRFVDMGIAPIISKSSTMVPLRFVSEILGARVDWSAGLQIITITLGQRVIQLQIGSLMALVDMDVVTLTAAPMLSQGRTLVPLRFVSESLGATVTWDGVLQTVTMVLAR